jgi:hypothetical protein
MPRRTQKSSKLSYKQTSVMRRLMAQMNGLIEREHSSHKPFGMMWSHSSSSTARVQMSLG